eukprot:CAMPEP_0178937360 /NCGR_PEP_ID=MMETSP0786-20121207/25707_1 /TAXON_ID=186022 /ORGANISM="Thalassionema frauenfeldii, Strain CCMP 1798" /LENGTH=169 /DNA_ID=CAMNT_0020615909 /DNA_START=75 /DNA_END=585 /DNA_ORIENTATION=-
MLVDHNDDDDDDESQIFEKCRRRIGVFLIPPVEEARADITNKLASAAALRKVRQGQQKLKEMEFYVVNNDYTSLQLALRKEPFFDIRKNSYILVRGGDDGPLAGDLERCYKTFMASLEKMDTTATLGLRGRRPLEDGEFYHSYRSTVESLENFLAVANEAAEIPVQYKD